MAFSPLQRMMPQLRQLLNSTLAKTMPMVADSGVRWNSTRGTMCKKDPFPSCSPKNLEKSKCMKSLKKKPDCPFAKLLFNPECCHVACVDVTRFDDLYYKPSDKLKRKYHRTWAECRDPIRLKKDCRKIKPRPPPMKRRKFKSRKHNICNASQPSGLMPCRRPKNPRCPKIIMPGCKAGRMNPRCGKTRVKTKCKKICTPYPSFSECKKPKPPRRHPIECRCNDVIPLCVVYRYLKKYRGKLPKY